MPSMELLIGKQMNLQFTSAGLTLSCGVGSRHYPIEDRIQMIIFTLEEPN